MTNALSAGLGGGAAAAAATDAVTGAPAKAGDKAAGDKGKAAEAEAAPKAVVKPRRDRKVRHATSCSGHFCGSHLNQVA